MRLHFDHAAAALLEEEVCKAGTFVFVGVRVLRRRLAGRGLNGTLTVLGHDDVRAGEQEHLLGERHPVEHVRFHEPPSGVVARDVPQRPLERRQVRDRSTLRALVVLSIDEDEASPPVVAAAFIVREEARCRFRGGIDAMRYRLRVGRWGSGVGKGHKRTFCPAWFA